MTKSALFILVGVGVSVAMLAGCGKGDPAVEQGVTMHRQLAGRQPAPAAAPSALLPDSGVYSAQVFVASARADGVRQTPAYSIMLAVNDSGTAAQPSETDLPYVPWQQRRGPAYPDRYWPSVGRDSKELPYTLWDDTKHSFTDPTVLIGLGLAGAAGIAINATGVDDTIADRTDGHRQLNSTVDGLGGFFGSPAVHFPFAGAMYLTTLAIEDEKGYETSKTLLNALIINGVLTQGLKWATRTESPNGDELGWPSGHTSSTFTLATVLYKAYGPWVGVPLYAFAGYVGYERIDARNHDFSDVISGMIIGIVIGHAVSENHDQKIFGMDLIPYANPNNGAVGLALRRQF